MKREKGFTVVEVVVVIVILTTLATFFILQRSSLEKASRDQQRKTAINAMYYALKEGYHREHGNYPLRISREQLPMIDPTLFTDPSGYTLNGDKCVYTNIQGEQKTNGKCEYRYSATDCDSDGKCKNFTLTAKLEAEADYTKSSHKK